MGAGKNGNQQVKSTIRGTWTVQLDKKTIFFVMDEFILLTRTF